MSDVAANKSTAHSKADTQARKKADLAGPGIGDYAELEKILPKDYNSLLYTQKKPRKRSSSQSATSKTPLQGTNLMMVRCR